ncbi:hypothetical protein [Mycolicibacterium fortuitum]|uniref:hypothetical protein n=1 Tax=Mycolicibacterium fortuitum TaxID=1766 RepID=UPI00262E5DFF|nr:hypothetical protein [Mycolicibacterium fortuitum]
MSDLPPEQIRDLADRLRAVAKQQSPSSHPDWFSNETFSANGLDDYADRLERAQAAEAKREQRIEELAAELRRDAFGTWGELARILIDRYPALAEVSTDE